MVAHEPQREARCAENMRGTVIRIICSHSLARSLLCELGTLAGETRSRRIANICEFRVSFCNIGHGCLIVLAHAVGATFYTVRENRRMPSPAEKSINFSPRGN